MSSLKNLNIQVKPQHPTQRLARSANGTHEKMAAIPKRVRMFSTVWLALLSSGVTVKRSLSMNPSIVLSSTRGKRLTIVRHGQAQHNPRAEAARAQGCNLDTFFQLMREDDALDAPLTEVGRKQATAARLSVHEAQRLQLVVSSPLSRAIETASLILPPLESSSSSSPIRMAYEGFREINGDMLNGKRRTKTELVQDFPDWNFDNLAHDHDDTWTPELEAFEAASERGYQGLSWLLERPEEDILLVSHGGLLKYTMTNHPLVVLKDERTACASPSAHKPVDHRFDNCEVRRYRLNWATESNSNGETKQGTGRVIALTQVDDPARSEL